MHGVDANAKQMSDADEVTEVAARVALPKSAKVANAAADDAVWELLSGSAEDC